MLQFEQFNTHYLGDRPALIVQFRVVALAAESVITSLTGRYCVFVRSGRPIEATAVIVRAPDSFVAKSIPTARLTHSCALGHRP
jgi:hypothetical protein